MLHFCSEDHIYSTIEYISRHMRDIQYSINTSKLRKSDKIWHVSGSMTIDMDIEITPKTKVLAK